MSNHVFITLDTKKPEVTMTAPNEINRATPQSVIIQSDESLLSEYSAFFSDIKGVKYPIELSISGGNLTGQLDLSGVPIGTGVVFVTVKDEVGNESRVLRKEITVTDDALLDIGDIEMSVEYMTIEMTAEKVIV
jgi:hypothetical protein